MGDIYIGRNEDGELTHSAKGTTWSKDGASYISRKKVNGKWVYTYRKLGKVKGNTVDTTNVTPSSRDVSERQRFAQNEAKTRFSISNRRAQQIQSEAESMKRKSVSAQRNIEKDPRYKVEAKAAYLKNKASRAARKNVAKGKKKVSEILSRLRESAAAARTEANKKARAAQKAASSAATQAKNSARKTKRKIKNAVSVKETAYITDVSTGKRRPAPTDLFDNKSNKKKYKKQAKAQRHTKRVIAREQVIGKVKHTIKNARSGEVNGYYRNKTAKPVSKNVDKKNAGKKR